MSSGLFRQEALLASAGSRFGNHVFHQPLSVRLLVTGVTLVFLGFVTFAVLAQIKQTELVRGYLTPTAGEIKLYSSRAGIFSAIHVSEGQLVSKSAVLATVADTQFDVGGNQASTVLLEHVEQQIRQWQERMQALQSRSLISEEQLRSRIAGFEKELLLLQEEFSVVQKRIDLGQQEFESSIVLVERGAISTREHNQVASNWYSIQQMSTSVRLNLQSKQLALEEARQQLAMQPLALEDELLLMQSNVTQLQARRDEISTQGTFTITAPADGVVANLVSRAGDTADPRMPFMTLVPADYHLQALLYLPSRSVGEVEIGQSIMLSYDAFPYQTHGTYAAIIASISAAAIDPREFLIPLELGEPVYLVHARIEQQSVTDSVERALRPGMQFSAEIITGSQSILQRLLSPLTSLGRKL